MVEDHFVDANKMVVHLSTGFIHKKFLNKEWYTIRMTTFTESYSGSEEESMFRDFMAYLHSLRVIHGLSYTEVVNLLEKARVTIDSL